MRTVLTLLVLVGGLVAGGCRSGGGCADSCRPTCERCWSWQPNCCNSWDWYKPCDLIEGRAVREGSSYETLPTCSCK